MAQENNKPAVVKCPIFVASNAARSVSCVTRGRPNPLHYTLAERLKKARKAANMTRQALSLKAGLANDTALRIEAEGRVPAVDTIERLARALNLSPCYLAFGVEDAPVPPADAPLFCEGIGHRLATARAARGLSMRALARAAESTDTTVRLTETGRTLPTVATAETLAKALSVSPCWLAYGVGAQEAQKPARRRKAAPVPGEG